jgi:ubiquinone/menaquinone biosynthesis C-methylase UbiE
MFMQLKTKLHNYFRVKRLKMFVSAYPNLSDLLVLDVGGTSKIWELLRKHYDLKPKRLIILNSNPVHLSANSAYTSTDSNNYETVVGNGCDLPFSDNSFDLVFSNSVIEHVGEVEDKAKFAKECDRVGKKIYIQTPNRWFPIEPHILAVFIHWLPRAIYRKLYFLSVIYFYQTYLMLTKGDSGHINALNSLDGADLLSYQQLKKIFSKHKIVTEKVLGFTKSFIVLN